MDVYYVGQELNMYIYHVLNNTEKEILQNLGLFIPNNVKRKWVPLGWNMMLIDAVRESL